MMTQEYCIRCRHEIHPMEGWCAAPTGNHIYDTKCKCTQSVRSGSLEGIVRVWLEWLEKHKMYDNDLAKFLDDIHTAVEFEIANRKSPENSFPESWWYCYQHNLDTRSQEDKALHKKMYEQLWLKE